MNKISTIQLNENVKKMLERLKEKKNESYEDVIVKLIDEKEKEKKRVEQLLIMECKEMYGEYKKISKEWEGTLMDGLDKDGEWNLEEGK